MFTANEYKSAKRVYDQLVVSLPHQLNRLSLEGRWTVNFSEINENVGEVIAAFKFLEKTNADFNRVYCIYLDLNIVLLNSNVVERAIEIDSFLRDNRHHLLGTEFKVATKWDKDILDIRGFVLEPNKEGKFTIQLKPEDEFI